MTYLIESFGYAYNLAYHYRAGYPFSTYGDFALLGVQNCIIMALIFYYGNQWLPRGILTLLLFIGGTLYASWPQSTVPLSVLERLCSLNIAIVIGSRLPQILANARRKHTGSLSLATCVGLFGGAAARVFTTLQQVQNRTILLGYLVSASLNGVLVAQILMYRKQTQAVSTSRGPSVEMARTGNRKTKEN
jgi:mannose-P-dolichol utilization defect protein 1